MIAAIIRFELKMDQMQEGTMKWSMALEEMHNVKQQEKRSLRGWTLMVDRATGHGMAAGYWENAHESQEHGTSSEYRESIKKLQYYCTKPPVREQYEVVAGNVSDVKIPTHRRAA